MSVFRPSVTDDPQARLLREMVLSGVGDRAMKAEGFTLAEIAAARSDAAKLEPPRNSGEADAVDGLTALEPRDPDSEASRRGSAACRQIDADCAPLVAVEQRAAGGLPPAV